MTRTLSTSLIAMTAILAVACSGTAMAALFQDNFDTDTSANYSVFEPTPGDSSAAVTFAYDYSADGIPAAPGSATTLGVKFEVNKDPNTPQEDAITIAPTGQVIAGDVQLRFHMWINAPGSFPGGGSGSTEFFTAGVAHDGASHNLADSTTPAAGEGSGAWFAVTGEGGTTNDYQGLVGITRPFVANASAANLVAAFPGIDVAAVNGGALTTAQGPSQTGTTQNGSQGFAWRDVIVRRVGDDVSWIIDGVKIATIDATGTPDGAISLGMSDGFSSVANNLAFGLADNLIVTVPEPSTMVLLGLGGLGLAFRRKK